MAEPARKVARMEPLPTLTVAMLSGATVWGPRVAERGTTARELGESLSRPMGCPGVELVHEASVLLPDADVSRLPDGAQLTVNFQPPLPFDHGFVDELLAYDGVNTEQPLLVPTRLKASAVKVPGAEVLRADAIYFRLGNIKLQLRLRVPHASQLLAKDLMELEGAEITWGFDGEVSDATSPVYGFRNRRSRNVPLIGGAWSELEAADGFKVVHVNVMTTCDEVYEWSHIIELSAVDSLFQKHMAKRVFEGVSASISDVSSETMHKLNQLLDVVKATEPADYHPGAGGVVRDLVHPSLYPYIKNVSAIAADLPASEARVVESANTPAGEKTDMWNRSYETSDYQWLPAEVSVSQNGKCEFDTYINNLPKEKYGELYVELGELLSKCLPHLEAAWTHANAVNFLTDEFDVYEVGSDAEDDEVIEQSLRGRNLQVIVKVVDYELQPGQTHEGVWHVEGMSHENIVATAELVLQKSSSLVGGDLEFQRAWTQVEGGRLSGLPQCRAQEVDACIAKGLCPLGRLPLELGQLTAWPNSHVHKLSPLKNEGDHAAQRRIVVFWLVNPNKRIVSTRHVPPQQGAMSLEEAKAHRLKLMEERKRHKQDWNVREVSLCEH
eukprot:TRINITY_DN2477_c0_g1_i1.p1 TRINITY_DN2477_c0_g1~~TRINITY_DN2477_c0_g1_i1.p1  ORF type:complete len:611 (+),score=91.58 TRINITY_DN2477_c0_g1_i1:169-2001(+)